MKKSACFILLAAWMFALVPAAHAETPAEPTEPSVWAAEAVREAASLGMVPKRLQCDWQRELTREEFAQLLIRFLAVQYGYTGNIGEGPSPEDFLEDYLSLRAAPDGGMFSKSDYLTEEETSSGGYFSWQGILAQRINAFEDIEDGEAVYINLAYLLGIVKGRDETHYYPGDTVTRQEAAALLCRTYRSYGSLELHEGASTSFVDGASVAPWAVEDVAVMASWDILCGDENQAFLPLEHYTREQGVLTLMRLYKNMPVSRYHATLAPLLTRDEVTERLLTTSGSEPTTQFRAETELCTVLCLTYGGVMHPPAPAIFLVYPDSSYRRIEPPMTPQEFQLTDQETKLVLTGSFGERCTLDLQSGNLVSTDTRRIDSADIRLDSYP